MGIEWRRVLPISRFCGAYTWVLVCGVEGGVSLGVLPVSCGGVRFACLAVMPRRVAFFLSL
jgi:hypothetical protein